MPHPRTLAAATVAALSMTAGAALAQDLSHLSRGHRLLIRHGLQLHGMTSQFDVFHLDTLRNANYTAVGWMWDSVTPTHGPPPGFPWSRWVRSEAEMPPLLDRNEAPYMPSLVALQLGDEYNLNDPVERQKSVDWMNAARPNFPNTLLYVNNYGSQVSDAALDDFIRRGRPDMISFDTYPYVQGSQPVGGSPWNWYSDMWRYRAHALAHGIPFAQYRQTFHDDFWRDPSHSEARLNTFAALAYGVTFMADFTYNTGNSSLFQTPGGDTHPKPAYYEMARINAEARHLGKALVNLKPIAERATDHVTSMMFLRGRHAPGPGLSVPNNLPWGFLPDTQAPNSYSDWEFQRNDPWLSGFVVDNVGTSSPSASPRVGETNNDLAGDVILSWFTPLDEVLDGPDFSNQIYLMVTNGLADMNASPAQTRQRITLTFGSTSLFFPYTHLERLSRLTGQIELVPLSPVGVNRKQLILELDGGTADLFKFPTGAPWVGFHPIPEPAAAFSLLGATLVAAAPRPRRRSRPRPTEQA